MEFRVMHLEKQLNTELHVLSQHMPMWLHLSDNVCTTKGSFFFFLFLKLH